MGPSRRPAHPPPVSTPNTYQVATLRNAIAAVDSMIAVNASTNDTTPEMQSNLTRKPTQITSTHPQATVPDMAAASKARLLNLAGTQIATPSQVTSGVNSFTPPIQQTLLDLNINLTKTSLVSALAQLNQHLIDLFVASAPFHEASPPLESSDPPPPFLAAPPSSHGSMVLAGIVNLLLVREHVLRYEPGEIAFVENVAAGEAFKRETICNNATLNSTLTSTLSSSQTEHDLQTSDRFNLQQQTQNAANQSACVGVSSSAAYGPLIDSVGSASRSTAAASSFG